VAHTMTPADRRVVHLATSDLTVRFLLLPQLRRLLEDGWDVAAVSAPGPWTDEVEAAGIRHIAWPNATRAWDPAADLRAARELGAILRRERPAVLHCHSPKAGVLGRLVGRRAGVPVVVNTVHGFYASPGDRVLRRWPVMTAEWLAARRSRLELYQSAEDLVWARRLGVAVPGRSRLLGNGVDLRRFTDVDPEARDRVRRSLGIADGTIVVGTVGRITHEKGFGELVGAAARVRAGRDEIRFLVVGAAHPGGIDEAVLADAAGHVDLLGWRTDVPEVLSAMDVFVLASWREGVPRSAIEAAAAGLPLILTDIRGCREVGGDAAVFVPPRDEMRLAEAILGLTGDGGARRRLGDAARRRALERFDEARVCDVVAASSAALSPARDVGVGRLRRARRGDVAAIAELHRRALPDAALPRLGDPFLRRFHRALIDDREATVVVVEAGGRVVGFASGVPSMRRFARRFVLRHGLAAGLELVRGGGVLGGGRLIVESARYARGSSGGGPTGGELIAVAVAPSWRGRGFGRELAASVVDALRAGGCRRVRVLVGAGNDPAIGLYRALGFRARSTIEAHRGVVSEVLVA